jgi:hypothetical protein
MVPRTPRRASSAGEAGPGPAGQQRQPSSHPPPIRYAAPCRSHRAAARVQPPGLPAAVGLARSRRGRAFAAHPSAAGAPADALDATLAGLSGYFVTSGAEEEVETSPYLRAHQRYYAELALDWLARRHGWHR